jgi:PncC family amidohydrolase
LRSPDIPLHDSAALLIEDMARASLTLVLAESCTAGLVADLLAGVPGASRVLWGSFVTYSPEAKKRMLGVDDALLRDYGAVSRETALAMAEGALERSGADMTLSVTGLAGPDGDGSPVPVGTVWIGTAFRGGEGEAVVFHFTGTRNEIRSAAAGEALNVLLRRLKQGIKTEGTVRPV